MSTTRRQHVADVVKAARAFQGMTQAELASAVGVHTQTIGNLERGTVETSPELITALERVLKIDLSPVAMVSSASAEVIKRELVRRFSELGEAESLLLAGETLRFILAWGTEEELADRARRVEERREVLRQRREDAEDDEPPDDADPGLHVAADVG